MTPSLNAERVGELVLVVGPSGVGKDTLIRGARRSLDGDLSVVFPQREITRSELDQAEDYVNVDPQDFDRREKNGEYALSWRAHGLAYGVAATIVEDLLSGKTVVLNVSRTIVESARALGWPVRVACVNATTAAIKTRLIRRGRDTTVDIVRRLQRQVERVHGDDVIEICNDGPVEDGIQKLVEIIGGKSHTPGSNLPGHENGT